MKGWIPRKVLLVSLVVGFSLFGDSLLYSVLPANVAAFGLQAGLVGVILSANRLIRLLSNAWAARVYNRVGLRWPLIAAVAGAVASTGTYGLARGFWPLLLARVLWGISFSFLRLGGYLAVLEESTDSTRGRLMGFFNSVWRSGSLVAVTLGSVLTDVVGYRRAFVTFAGLSALGFFFAVLASREGGRPRPVVRYDDSGPEAHRQALRVKRRSDASDSDSLSESPLRGQGKASGGQEEIGGPLRRWVWSVLVSDIPHSTRLQRLRLLSVSVSRFVVGFAVQGLVVGTLGFYLRERLGDEAHFLGLALGVTTVTGLMLGSRWLVDLGFSTPLGYLSDRLGRRPMVYAAMPVVIVLLLLLALAPSPVFALPLLPVMFLAAVATFVTLDASAGDLAPLEQRAQVMGRYATWSDMGTALAALVGYAVVTTVGLPALYLAGATLLVGGLALYVYAFQGRRS